MILIADLPDPNTGALGRTGIITRATYNAETDTTELEIDNSDDFIAQIRAGLAAGVR